MFYGLMDRQTGLFLVGGQVVSTGTCPKSVRNPQGARYGKTKLHGCTWAHVESALLLNGLEIVLMLSKIAVFMGFWSMTLEFKSIMFHHRSR